MNNEEYARRLGIMYQKLLDLRSEDDYIVNQPQLEKLMKIVEFFLEQPEHLGGSIESIDMNPKEEHGGVTATFLIFTMRGESVKKFCEVIQHASAVSIDGSEDGICISCTVPNVFVHK